MPHVSFPSFLFQWSGGGEGTVDNLRWEMNLEKLILLLMDHQALYDVSYIPDSILFLSTGCTHSWSSTRRDFAGVFAFLRIARFFAVSLWVWLDSTLLVSAQSNCFTDQEFRAYKKRRVIFAPLSGTCSIRADFSSVIILALINRLHTKY
jgi:hypothetical protein